MDKIVKRLVIVFMIVFISIASVLSDEAYAVGATYGNMMNNNYVAVTMIDSDPFEKEGEDVYLTAVKLFTEGNKGRWEEKQRKASLIIASGEIQIYLKDNNYYIDGIGVEYVNNFNLEINPSKSFATITYTNDNIFSVISIYLKKIDENKIPYNIEYYINNEKLTEAEEVGTAKTGSIISIKGIDDLKISNNYKLTSIYNSKNEKVTQMEIDKNNRQYRVFYSNTYELMDEIEIKWSRSKEGNDKEYLGAHYSSPHIWNWSVLNGIKHSETICENIWDGLRNDNHENGLDIPSGNYATWKCTQSYKYDIRRFYGEFIIPDGFSGSDYIRVKPVDQEKYISINNGNILPINDNIYVFVYKLEDSRHNNVKQINEGNYLDYLAFWTGTDNKKNLNSYISGPNGERILGTKARQVLKGTGEYNLLKHTDGWYCEAPLDNIGAKMSDAKPGDKYAIDIFTEECLDTGGMDRFAIEFIKSTAPTTYDDNYVCAGNQTISVNGDYSVLKNDKSNNKESSSLKMRAEFLIGDIKQRENAGDSDEFSYELYSVDNSEELAGTVKFTKNNEEDGLFDFKAAVGFKGCTEFKYNCIDNREKTEGTVRIFVLPYVDAKHITVNSSNKKTVKDIDRVYRWDSEAEWEEEWLWPDEITNKTMKIGDINANVSIAPKENKTTYSFSPKSYEGYIYYDSSSSISDNKSNVSEIELYYRPTKSTVYINFKDQQTGEIIKDQVSQEFNGNVSYREFVEGYQNDNVIEGYEYKEREPKDLPNGGKIKNGNVVIDLYYSLKDKKYTIEYYIGDSETPYSSISGTAKYGTVINDDVYYINNKINDLNKSMGNGDYVVLDEVDNYPCTIKDVDNNIIKIRFEIKNEQYYSYFTYATAENEKISLADTFEYEFCLSLNRKGKFDITLGLEEDDKNKGLKLNDFNYKIEPIGINPDNIEKNEDGSCKVYIDTINYSAETYTVIYKVSIFVNEEAKDEKGMFRDADLLLIAERKMQGDDSNKTATLEITLVPKPYVD